MAGRVEDEDGRRSMDEPRPAGGSAQDRIDRACWLLMTDPELAMLREWWVGETDRSVLPPGSVDTNRLLMVQGDRERRLAIMARAERHRVTKLKT
jgi:hypothetical protein